jgi:hypothetical protein
MPYLGTEFLAAEEARQTLSVQELLHYPMVLKQQVLERWCFSWLRGSGLPLFLHWLHLPRQGYWLQLRPLSQPMHLTSTNLDV